MTLTLDSGYWPTPCMRAGLHWAMRLVGGRSRLTLLGLHAHERHQLGFG
jgi:hypothetical protein